MGPPTKEKAICPRCQTELLYIEHYGSYYCSSCDEHFELASENQGQEPSPVQDKGMRIDAIEELIQSEDPEYKEQRTPEHLPPPPSAYHISEEPTLTKEIPDEQVNEDPLEYEESTSYKDPPSTVPISEDLQTADITDDSSQIQEQDEYESELETQSPEDTQAEEEVVEKKSKKKKKTKLKFKRYRYRTRMIKGSILPIIFGLISFQMINSSRLQFPDYYELEAMMILAGFMLGFASISAITLVNLVKSKKNLKDGYKLNMKVGFVAYIPFISIFLGLTLFVSLSTGWKFATGFFLASIFPILIVTLFEVSSKGKFFVKEVVDDPSWGRKLVFRD
jgi:hypothetical protein